MNSCDWLPPIAPECASTAMYFKPAAVEDPAVRLVVLVDRRRRVPPASMSKEYESFMMNCRTRSRPHLGPRLIAKLGLDLIPDLRQLLVAAQFAARDRRS